MINIVTRRWAIRGALGFVISLTTNLTIYSEAAPAKKLENVVVIGWDGCDRSRVLELMSAGRLPHLDALAKDGHFVPITVRGTTDSVAGWSEILTGYGPEVTGVFSGQRYTPLPETLSPFPHLKRAWQIRGKQLFCAAILAKAGSFGNTNFPKHPVPDTQLMTATNAEPTGPNQASNGTRTTNSNPGVACYFWRTLDVWVSGAGSNAQVAQIAIDLIERHRSSPFFIFVHFADADAAGHTYGEQSDQYKASISNNDYWTGQIINKLRTLGLLDKTLVVVATDHGFNRASKAHTNAPDAFLVTNDPLVREPGTRADIMPTIFDRLGMDMTLVTPPFTGKTLAREQ